MFRDEIDISTDPEVVWALTEDVARWPEITSTITAVEPLDPGPLAVGRRFRLTQPMQRPRVWTVIQLDPPRRFAWQARMGPVTMTGGHTVEAAPGGCRNVLTLELSGFGAGLLRLLAGRQLRGALRTENEGFRRRAEQVAGPDRA